MLQEDGTSSVTTCSPLQFFSMMPFSPGLGSSSHPWLKELKSEERGLYLIHLLLSCTNHVANGCFENANVVLEQISQLATPNGDTMQRIAAYFTEALAERILKSWPGLYKALRFTRTPVVLEEILVRKLFAEIFPFVNLGLLVTNQAIMEAMEGEKVIHIIDLNVTEPARWVALIQALSARPEGPPHLRITGVHQEKEVLDQVAHRLTGEAEKLDIPFQFNPVISRLDDLDVEKLRVKTGEAVAICSLLQLHTLLSSQDEAPPPPLGKKSVAGMRYRADHRSSPSNDSTSSDGSWSKLDNFLAALWGLSPKLVVVTEQDTNHNGSALMERLLEALYFYAALFDCLESTMPRTSIERMKVEKILFGEEIKNIIACEGAERKERHQKLQKWIQRLDMAGFANVPLSYISMLQARRLLQGYGCDGYRIKEDNGCIVVCWQDRPLFSISAWRCRSTWLVPISIYLVQVPEVVNHPCSEAAARAATGARPREARGQPRRAANPGSRPGVARSQPRRVGCLGSWPATTLADKAMLSSQANGHRPRDHLFLTGAGQCLYACKEPLPRPAGTNRDVQPAVSQVAGVAGIAWCRGQPRLTGGQAHARTCGQPCMEAYIPAWTSEFGSKQLRRTVIGFAHRRLVPTPHGPSLIDKWA
ncbi:Scarecrow-like protein 3 [Dionaea muscipula]